MNRGNGDSLDLPYGADFRFVDRVVAFVANETIETEKVYLSDLPIVAAHFMNGPKVVPGVILVEQMCQSALLLGIRSELFRSETVPMLAEIKVRFLHPVMTDATVLARVTIGTCLRDVMTFTAKAMASGRTVCQMSGMVIVRPFIQVTEKQGSDEDH